VGFPSYFTGWWSSDEQKENKESAQIVICTLTKIIDSKKSQQDKSFND